MITKTFAAHITPAPSDSWSRPSWRDVPAWVWLASLMGLAMVVASLGEVAGLWSVSSSAQLGSIIFTSAFVFGALCGGGARDLVGAMVEYACYKAISDALSRRK